MNHNIHIYIKRISWLYLYFFFWWLESKETNVYVNEERIKDTKKKQKKNGSEKNEGCQLAYGVRYSFFLTTVAI